MERMATSVVLWLYWAVLLAVIVLAIPVIVTYALMFDED